MRQITARARLYAQLAFVADCDAAALRHEYELCPLTNCPIIPTSEELSEAARLDAIAESLFGEARILGFSGGTDAAFGEQS